MFRNERLELKVGLFIGIGIFVMFFIVFSIRDVSLLGKGYEFEVNFDYVNGINESSPVRLAGVNVGEVKKITLYYDETAGKTQVRLDVWVKGSVKIEDDAVARINTLGLLGEQYLEISPGESETFVQAGDVMRGKNPLNVGQQMESMQELASSMSVIIKNVSKGEGTLGKLIMDDTIYEDMSVIFGRLKDGEGTIGKLLVDETIYNDMEDFVSDIKAHPWKLLSKPRGSSRSDSESTKRGTTVSTR